MFAPPNRCTFPPFLLFLSLLLPPSVLSNNRMHHIAPVYTHQSDTGVGGYPLPMHRDPTVRTVRSEAATTPNKGSRSWFAPPQGTVKSHLVGMLSEFVGSTYLSFFLFEAPSLTIYCCSDPVRFPSSLF
jgi:hypothetical protein